MKKLIIFLSIMVSLVFIGLTKVNAQITLKTVTITGNATATVVNEKVTNSFNQLFKDATAPQWLEVNKRFVVNFILNDQKNRAVFTKNGDLVYHLTYGTAENVPDNFTNRVKRQFPDYMITSAVKVATDEVKLWILNLENSKKIIVIRVTDDDINVIDKFPKS